MWKFALRFYGWWRHFEGAAEGRHPIPSSAGYHFSYGHFEGQNARKCCDRARVNKAGPDPLIRDGSEKAGALADVCGLQIWEMGTAVLGGLQGVLKLCSQTTDGGSDQGQEVRGRDTFPLPTSRDLLSPFAKDRQLWCTDWLMAVCTALNSLWGCQPKNRQEEDGVHQLQPVTTMQARVIRGLLDDVARMKDIRETTAGFEWEEFFRTRTIDYRSKLP